MISWAKKQWNKMKLMLKGRKALNEAIKNGQLASEAYENSGWQSTEFWVAVLSGLAGVAAQSQGLVPEPYGAIVASVSVALYQISRGLAKKGDPLGGVKPGAATSEFWINALAQVGAVAAASAGALKPEQAAIAMLVSNGAYGLSRGLAKGGAQPGS